MPGLSVAFGTMRYLFLVFGFCLFFLVGNTQNIYHTPVEQPEQHLRKVEQKLATYQQQITRLAEAAQINFSDNEAFHLTQIANQVQTGKTYYLNMILAREPAFAKKLQQTLDTTWLRETALSIQDIQTRRTAWQEVLDGTPLPPPPTFLAEAERIDVRMRDDVLEIGAGNGAFSLALYREVPGASYWINELDTTLLDPLAVRLQRQYAQAPIQLVRGQTVRTGMPRQSVDKIILRQVLHHLSRPDDLLQDIRQTLRTQGKLFLLESYAESCAICCDESWTRARIQATLQQHGFQQVAEYGIPQSSFYLTVWEVHPR